MKKTIITLALISLGLSSLAQEGVKVASDVSPPDPSAMFEVESSSKGVLIPRVDIIDLNTAAPVSNPATSLMVYNTNTTSGPGFYYWNGSKWSNLSASQENEDWKVIGTVGTMVNGEPIPNYMGNFTAPVSGNLMPLSIRKRSDGVVEIKGAFYAPTGGIPLSIFETPTGYKCQSVNEVRGALMEATTLSVGYIYVMSSTSGVWYSSLSSQSTYWVDLSYDVN